MRTTLMIEVGYQTAKIALYNKIDDTLHYLDITGGYGKRAIPLHLHYISEENTYLIGEDAINYDEDETTTYISNVLDHEPEDMCHFIDTVTDKVTTMIPNMVIEELALIFNGDKRINTAYPSVRGYFLEKDIVVSKMTFLEAVCGWYLDGNLSETTSFHYFDDKYAHYYKLSLNEESKVFIESYIQKEFSLFLMDSFYKSYLHHEHKNIHSDTDIERLYNDQMVTLYSQIIKNKDVSVYSSLDFPPIRIKVSLDKVNLFMKQFEDEYCSQFQTILENECGGFYSGAYDKKVFVDSYLDFKEMNYRYVENSILDGAFYVLKNNLDESFMVKNIHDVRIGIMDSDDKFIPLHIQGDLIKSWHEIGLILTGYEDVIRLVEHIEADDYNELKCIKIDNAKECQRVKLMCLINELGQLEEVKYEFRSL